MNSLRMNSTSPTRDERADDAADDASEAAFRGWLQSLANRHYPRMPSTRAFVADADPTDGTVR